MKDQKMNLLDFIAKYRTCLVRINYTGDTFYLSRIADFDTLWRFRNADVETFENFYGITLLKGDEEQ